MPLTTVVPSAGPQAGNLYVLPWCKEPPKLSLHYGGAYTPVARGQGSVVQSGTGKLYVSGADISAIHVFTGNWAKNIAGYADTSAGTLRTALYDFQAYVMDGGMLTMTLTPPPGMHKGRGSVTGITYATAECWVSGDAEWDIQNGGTYAEVTVDYFFPSANCVLSDGSVIGLFAIF